MERIQSKEDSENIDRLIAKGQPFYIENIGYLIDTNDDEKSCIWIQEILKELMENETVIDVSCAEADEMEYSGNPMNRESVDLRIKDFVEGFFALMGHQQHWIANIGLNLYLSQLCLYSKDVHATQIHGIHQIKDFPPNILQNKDLDMVNLWMNIPRSRSTLHYDANHNLLTVHKGSKRVFLISPELQNSVNSISLFTDTPNHTSRSFLEIVDIFQTLQKERKYDSKLFEIEIRENQALFIPEGWWHQVDSQEFTIAVNYWFSSPLQPYLNDSSILPYVVRQSINRLVLASVKENFRNERDNIRNNLNIYTQLTTDTFGQTVIAAIHEIGPSRETKELQIIYCQIEDMERFWTPFIIQVCE